MVPFFAVTITFKQYLFTFNNVALNSVHNGNFFLLGWSSRKNVGGLYTETTAQIARLDSAGRRITEPLELKRSIVFGTTPATATPVFDGHNYLVFVTSLEQMTAAVVPPSAFECHCLDLSPLPIDAITRPDLSDFAATPAQPGVLFLAYSRLVRDDPVIGVRQQAFYRIIDATHVEGPRHRAVR